MKYRSVLVNSLAFLNDDGGRWCCFIILDLQQEKENQRLEGGSEQEQIGETSTGKVEELR